MPGEATEARVWRQALKRLLSIESCWADLPARQRALLECRHWLEEQTAAPRLRQLARLVDPAADRARLTSVLVPVEREVGRRRVTDVQILDRDAPAERPSGARLPLILVADSLRSAFNVGGLLRTAECFGAEAVWLCGYSATPEHPHVAEAALGADRLVPWRACSRTAEALEDLRRGGRSLVALETVAGAADLAAFHWPFPCALLLGNERFGLAPDLVAQADACVRIPVFGRKNSLNVVSAAAIALHAARCAWHPVDAPTQPVGG
jgi:tRNA G18 (ribose-2'-O)-methylase SpoU